MKKESDVYQYEIKCILPISSIIFFLLLTGIDYVTSASLEKQFSSLYHSFIPHLCLTFHCDIYVFKNASNRAIKSFYSTTVVSYSYPNGKRKEKATKLILEVA